MDTYASFFQIEEMSFEDIDEVLEISNELPVEVWTVEGYRSELNNPDSILFVAKASQTIVGFIIARLIKFQINSSPSKIGIEAEIYNLAVAKKFQQKGIGRQLIREIFRRFELSKAFLEVRESNIRAIKFYRKEGFSVIGKRKNFYRNPQEDALLMSLNHHLSSWPAAETLD